MRRFRTLSLCMCFAALVGGCGGGGGGGTSDSGGGAPEKTVQMGPASVTYTGDLNPLVGSGVNNVTITGLSGGALSKVVLSPAQTLSNSVIAFSTVYKGELYTSVNGSVSLLSSQATGSVQDVCFTPDGRIAYVAMDNLGKLHAYTCNYDGSNVKQIATTANLGHHLSWAPNNLHIAYDGPGGIYVAHVDGSYEYLEIANESDPQFSPDSSKMAFVAPSVGHNQIFVDNPYVVGSANTLISANNRFVDCATPAWAPDGIHLAYTAQINNNSSSIAFADSSGVATTPIYDASLQHDSVRYSPDGKYIAYTERLGSNTPDTNRMIISDYVGSNPVAISGTEGAGRLAWSPMFKNRVFVGTGGAMLAAGAGFLWGQQGTYMASMLTFNAKTPSTATITSMNNSGGALVYQVHADSITDMRYSNNYYGLIVAPIIASAPTPNALVSFDGSTGQVSAILPLLVKGRTRNVSHVAGSNVYVGDFAGVWNAKGVNLAPGGATRVTLDAKTGAPIVAR